MATKVDKWTPLVIAALRAKFGDKTDQLFTLLQETGSLISGGSILAACLGEPIKKQDTDIYVTASNIPRFLNEMVMKFKLDNVTPSVPIFPATHYKQYAASFYCSSFLRKNGIRKVYNFGGPKGSDLSEVDIMSVRNTRGPLAVVNNFDLTFCQVWFNGRNVYASHPDHIKTKSGFLQADYCLSLMSGNHFLRYRINKYMERGFKIQMDTKIGGTSLSNQLMSHIGQNANRYECQAVDGLRREKFNDAKFAQKWYNRIAMRYFLGIRDGDDLTTNEKFLIVPLKYQIYNSQIIRTDKDRELHDNYLHPYTNTGDPNRRPLKNIEDFVIAKDDGYDSDDMNEGELKQMALTDGGSDLDYYRKSTQLVFNAHVDNGDGEITLGQLARSKTYETDKTRLAKQLLAIIESKALRTGDDLFGNEGQLYDIHAHGIEGATTRASLEEYLGSTMTGDDYEPKCYYSGGGCDQKLQTHEIKAIVSFDFYARFSAPRPVKSGLDIEVDNFETVFRNIKTVDPAWGNIYHATMCPYCLKFEERGYGCAYMTHENPKGLSTSKAPFCAEGRVVSELINKYKDAGRKFGEGYSHLEFCVECGRPCSSHKHFNLDMTGLVNNKMIPDPAHPGQMMYDYGNCPGGGRPELIARMMAVRDVYRRKDLKDVVEERRIAALAADAAPNDPALMKRANALWLIAKPGIEWNEERATASAKAKAAASAAGKSDAEQRDAAIAASAAFKDANPEPPMVKWNVAVPKTKAYNDPLYAGVENDPEFTGWLDRAPAAAAPAPAAPDLYDSIKRIIPADHKQWAWNRLYLEGLQERLVPLQDVEAQDYLDILLQTARSDIYDQVEADGALIDINLVASLIVFCIYHEPPNMELCKYVIKAVGDALLIGGKVVKSGLDVDIIGEAYIGRFHNDLLIDIRAYVNKALGDAIAPAAAAAAAPAPAPAPAAAPAPAPAAAPAAAPAPAPAAAPAPAPAPALNALEAAALAHFEAGLQGGKRSDSKRRDSKRSDSKRSDSKRSDSKLRKTYKRRKGQPNKKTRLTRR